MDKNRLEAFSDGVLAIIITIMVLELKVPRGARFVDLTPLTPGMARASGIAFNFTFNNETTKLILVKLSKAQAGIRFHS